MRSTEYVCALLLLCAVACTTSSGSRHDEEVPPAPEPAERTYDPVKDFASAQVDDGRATFRFDTFGDEAFWGGTLQLHRAIAGAANGGVGGGVSPRAALELGLKVDVNAPPPSLRNDL